MMPVIRNHPIAALVALMLLAVPLAGCEEEGPAEQIGENIDNAVKDAADTLEDTADKVEEKVEQQ